MKVKRIIISASNLVSATALGSNTNPSEKRAGDDRAVESHENGPITNFNELIKDLLFNMDKNGEDKNESFRRVIKAFAGNLWT